MTLIFELQRRKGFKVGAAYLVVAWLALQAASIGFPAFDAPPWALWIFLLVALLGFPIAVVTAWVYDITATDAQLNDRTSRSKRLFAAAARITDRRWSRNCCATIRIGCASRSTGWVNHAHCGGLLLDDVLCGAARSPAFGGVLREDRAVIAGRTAPHRARSETFALESVKRVRL